MGEIGICNVVMEKNLIFLSFLAYGIFFSSPRPHPQKDPLTIPSPSQDF